MQQVTTKPEGVQAELARRHRAALRAVGWLFALTILLCILAYVSRYALVQRNSPALDMTWRIVIPILGLGAVTWRRTKFSATRLQDILALRGATGLLATLQRTTVQVALFGAAIAVIGFVVTMLTGLFFYMLGAGIIAVAVLLYCYPRRNAWQSALRGLEESDEANNPPAAKGSVV